MASTGAPQSALDELVFTHELLRRGGGEPDQVGLEEWVTRAYRLPRADLDAPDTADALAGAETIAEALCYGLDPTLADTLGVSLFDAADAHSGDAHTYYAALFEPTAGPATSSATPPSSGRPAPSRCTGCGSHGHGAVKGWPASSPVRRC